MKDSEKRKELIKFINYINDHYEDMYYDENNYNNIITTDILHEHGFKEIYRTYAHIKYKKNNIIIESYIGENGDGFTHKYKPVNTIYDLLSIQTQ